MMHLHPSALGGRSVKGKRSGWLGFRVRPRPRTRVSYLVVYTWGGGAGLAKTARRAKNEKRTGRPIGGDSRQRGWTQRQWSASVWPMTWRACPSRGAGWVNGTPAHNEY